MRKIIVVAGATGNLGGKIIKALLTKDVEVRAIVRLETDIKKIKDLEQKGVKVFPVDTSNQSEISKHCTGAHCMVSALAGLRKTIIDTQRVFLDAAIEADLDVPFACKGAVCCTCRAKVLEGKVIMDANFALTEQEVEDGYILTCQSHPITEKVVIDYDV